MKIIQNIITLEEVQKFKDYFDNNCNDEYVNWLTDSDKPLDIRLPIKKDTQEWEIITNAVTNICPDAKDIWSALQRQNFPHSIHIDDYEVPNPNTYTIVIALDTIPEFKTVVWQEKFESNAAFKKHCFKIENKIKSMSKLSTISEVEDLEHTPTIQNYKLCDYLTLDGIFSYECGSGVLFSARKLHCTSNWLKYTQYKHRNLLQIHFTTEKSYDF